MTIGDLILRIGADEAAWNGLRDLIKQTRSELKEFAEGAETIGKAFDAAFTAPADKLISFAEDFKHASNIITQATGATGEALKGYKDSFEAVFSTVGQSSEKVASTLGILATRLDLTGEPLEKLTKQFLQFAKVTGEDVGPLAERTTKLFQAWNVATEDMAAAMDHLNQVSQASGIKMADLEGTLQQFGPVLREIGIDFDDAANLIGNLEHAGVNVQPVMAGITKALATMSKAGLKDPLEGLQALFDKIKQAKTEGEAFAIGATAMGKSAASAVEAIRSGKLDIDDFVGSLQLGTKTVAEQASSMKTLTGGINQLKNEIEAALAPIGERLAHALESVVKAARPVVDAFADIVGKFSDLDPELQEGILLFGSLLAAIGPVLGIAAGIGAALSTMLGPLTAIAGVLGTGGLVALAIGFGAAIAGWVIYKAVTDLQKLETRLQSLYDLMDRGEVASKGQSDTIAVLEDAIKAHNRIIGNKPIDLPRYNSNDQALNPDDYLKALKKITAGFTELQGISKDATHVMKDGAINVGAALDDLGGKTAAAGAKSKAYGKDTTDALNSVLKGLKGDEYKKVEEQIKKLEEIVGGKSLQTKLLLLADLQRQAFNPNEGDNLNKLRQFLDEKLKLARASNQQISDETLQASADLNQKIALLQIANDTHRAFSVLGVVSAADLDNQVDQIEAALAKVNTSVLASDDDRVRAAIAASDKEIAIWRQEGATIEDEVIATAESVKAAWQRANVDLGQAFSNLGVKSFQAVNEELALNLASVEAINRAVRDGWADQVDADNAEIASLQRKQAALANVGKALSDIEQARLTALNAAKQAGAMSTDQAFAFLGIPSEADLEAAVTKIEAAFDKATSRENLDLQTFNALRAAELGKLITEYRKAGEEVTADMLNEWKRRTSDAKIAAMDIDQAFKMLGALSTQDLVDNLKELDAAFLKISEDADTTSGQLAIALQNKLQGTIDNLKKAGEAASNELVRQLENAQTKVLLSVGTINDAYKRLGVDSTNQLTNNLKLAADALEKINNDVEASDFQRVQAQIKYNEEYFQNVVKTGGQVDEYLNAQTVLTKQRQQALLSDQSNAYLAFANTVKEIYGSIQNSLADVITGAKSVGQAFADIGQAIEKALVKFVINNLILTQDRLNDLQRGLNSILHELLGFGQSATSTAVGAAGTTVEGAVPGATGEAASAGQAASGGLLGSLGSIVSVVGVAVNAISGIVSGIQQAHANSLLDKIEKSTRRTDITLEGPDGVNEHVKATRWNTAGLWTDLGSSGWYHDAFASLMTTTEGILAQLKTMQLTGGGGTTTPKAPAAGPDAETYDVTPITLDPNLDQSTREIEDFTGALKNSVTYINGAVGSTVQLGAAAETVTSSVVSTDSAVASLSQTIDGLLDHLKDLEKAHQVNSDDWDATKTQLIDLSRQQAEANKILAAQGKVTNDLSGSMNELLGVSQYAVPVINGISQSVVDSMANMSTAVLGLKDDTFGAALAISTAADAIDKLKPPVEFTSETFDKARGNPTALVPGGIGPAAGFSSNMLTYRVPTSLVVTITGNTLLDAQAGNTLAKQFITSLRNEAGLRL